MALITCQDLTLGYENTPVAEHLSFTVEQGDYLCIVGENGSGKSTLMKTLLGLRAPLAGHIRRGDGLRPNEVGYLPQQTPLQRDFPASVQEVVLSGCLARCGLRPFYSRDEKALAARNMERLGIAPLARRCYRELSGGQQQRVLLARALCATRKLLLLDEPVAGLDPKATAELYDLVAGLNRADGITVIMISHDIDEVMDHCDVLTVLRDGVAIADIEKAEFSSDLIKSRMVGREIQGNYYRTDSDGYDDEVVLKADCITTMKNLLCFDLELHKGEILGIGGLSDCGIHTIGRALYGLEDIVDGSVILPQKNNIAIDKPKTAFDNGVGYVSKNRDTESLELNASIKANIASTGYRKNRKGPFVDFHLETDYVAEQINKLLIKCQGPWQVTRALSGGNKQKVVFGKWCAYDAQIMILDCPTRGVDVGVKAAMYQLIYSMKKEGKSIVLISEELPELCGMSDRLLIIKDGKVSGEFFRKDGFDERVLVDYMI